MANQFLRIGLFACALTAAAGPGLAGGPTKADLEKALSACPPGESEGSDGLCSPTGDTRMGFDFVPQGDSGPTSGAPHADPATAHHRVVARIEKPGAVVGGFADLQITFGNASWELTDGDRDTADTLAVVMLEPDLAHKLVEISGYYEQHRHRRVQQLPVAPARGRGAGLSHRQGRAVVAPDRGGLWLFGSDRRHRSCGRREQARRRHRAGLGQAVGLRRPPMAKRLVRRAVPPAVAWPACAAPQ